MDYSSSLLTKQLSFQQPLNTSLLFPKRRVPLPFFLPSFTIPQQVSPFGMMISHQPQGRSFLYYPLQMSLKDVLSWPIPSRFPQKNSPQYTDPSIHLYVPFPHGLSSLYIPQQVSPFAKVSLPKPCCLPLMKDPLYLLPDLLLMLFLMTSEPIPSGFPFLQSPLQLSPLVLIQSPFPCCKPLSHSPVQISPLHHCISPSPVLLFSWKVPLQMPSLVIYTPLIIQLFFHWPSQQCPKRNKIPIPLRILPIISPTQTQCFPNYTEQKLLFSRLFIPISSFTGSYNLKKTFKSSCLGTTGTLFSPLRAISLSR